MAGKIHGIAAAIVLSGFLIVSISSTSAQPLDDKKIGEYSRAMIMGQLVEKDVAIERLVARGKKDVVAAIILALRFGRNDPDTLAAFTALTGKSVTSWNEAMLWQEVNPQIKPHSSFPEIKAEIFERIDPQFRRFVGGKRSLPENMKIRLEEITWGGVPVDGIPSLDNPKLISAQTADYLVDSDLVFGVEINGDIRAYPLRIMGWHEMFNETIGGVSVALAYCTLCGAGILFETGIKGRDKPLVFGSSGFLYRSNKLMFDRETDSLWNQFTGEPVSGPLVNSGIKLKIRPVTITTWAKWKKTNPTTRVLSVDTGFPRNYGSGVVYNEYFASPDLMFPAVVRNEKQVQRKEYVFGIREFAAAKAWPIAAFDTDNRVINDAIGARNIVLVGDADSRTVRAYERGDIEFKPSAKSDYLSAQGVDWAMREEFLLSPQGKKLPRVPGHISFWFAWDSYLGVESSLYSAKDHHAKDRS